MNYHDDCPDFMIENKKNLENQEVGLCSDKDDNQSDEEEKKGLSKTEDTESDFSLFDTGSLLRQLIRDIENQDDKKNDDEDEEEELYEPNDDFLSGLLDFDSQPEPLDPNQYENIELSQLVGIKQVINNVQDSIIPLLKTVLGLKQKVPPVAGVMISGPKGTGKTHLALAIAAQLVKDTEIKVFRVRLGNPVTEDIDFDDIKTIASQLTDNYDAPAILLIDNIPGKSAFGTETMFMKPKIMEALADELMTLAQDVSEPLIFIGTTVDSKDLPADFFDLSLFPLSVNMEYPDASMVWQRLMDVVGLDMVDHGLDRNAKLTVRELKHLLKFALVHAHGSGREQVLQEDIHFAHSLMQAKAQAFGLPSEVPSVTLDSYIGDKTIKIVKEQLLLSIKYSDLAGHYGILPAKGVFITGPMGCGKTHLARCIAGELKWSLVQLNVGSFGSEYLHAHERQLHMMVDEWLGRQEPMVVLMDEVDNLVPLGAGNEDWAARTGNMVLLEIERLLHRQGEPLLVVAATSRPEDVNPALIRSGRLDLRVDIGFPDPRERESLFRLYLGEIGKDLDVSFAVQVAYTPAEIERVAKRTLWHAFVRATKTGSQSPPNEVDLQQAMKQIPPQDKIMHNRGSVSR